jgi:hypothetical protein
VICIRILYVGSYDPAAQLYLTAKALRDHVGYDAHSVITTPTWLDYDNDLVLGKNVQLEEVLEFAKTCDYLVIADLFGMAPQLKPVYDLCTPKNSCLMALGTPFRSKMPEVLYNQIHSGSVAVVPPMEVTLVPNVISTPLDHLIVDTETIDQLVPIKNQDLGDCVTICHATVGDNRGRILFENVVDQLIADGANVKLDVIRGVPWKETILRKAKAHITLDSIHIPIPGLNCMEGLYFGHEVVSSIDPWCFMVNPDMPIYSFHPAVTGLSLEDSLKGVLSLAIEQAQNRIDLGYNDRSFNEFNYSWVYEHYRPEIVAQRWKYFFNWAMRRGK